MAAIQASYTFSPALPNGSTIVVNADTESAVKAAVKAALEAKKAVVSTGVAACDTALSEMDS